MYKGKGEFRNIYPRNPEFSNDGLRGFSFWKRYLRREKCNHCNVFRTGDRDKIKPAAICQMKTNHSKGVSGFIKALSTRFQSTTPKEIPRYLAVLNFSSQ